MKYYILLSVVLLCYQSNAQSSVHFSYDEAGNRIRRYIILIDDSTNHADTVSTARKSIVKDSAANTSSIELTVYPNPILSDVLNIQATGIESEEILDYKLIDNLGKILIQSVVMNGNNTCNVGSLAYGNYILVVNGKKYHRIWKLIK